MSNALERILIVALSVVLFAAAVYSLYQLVYDEAFSEGVHAGAFAICVTAVQEDEEGYTVVIRLDDEAWLHYCYK